MKRNLSVILLCFFILTACSANSKFEENTAVPEPATAVDTATIQPTEISAAMKTPAPTVTFTATLEPTATLTPTPAAEFSALRLYGVEYRGSNVSINFEIPGMDQTYQMKINDQDYSCQLAADLADHLFCFGPNLAFDKEAHIEIMDETGSQKIYETDMVLIPPKYVSPTPVGDMTTWCPQRGQNVFCETENRMEYGTPCIVSSCFDACGYYYSIHTCNYPPLP